MMRFELGLEEPDPKRAGRSALTTLFTHPRPSATLERAYEAIAATKTTAPATNSFLNQERHTSLFRSVRHT